MKPIFAILHVSNSVKIMGSGYDVYHAQVMEGDLVNRLQVAMSVRV
jgi:hydroxypyruvate isomerase